MKLVKKISVAFIAAIMACTLMVSLSDDTKANAEYEIVFKAGLHGSVDSQTMVKHRVVAGQAFPNEPMVTANDGYVFSGWSKQLPGVGSKVDRKLIFVAKYDVLVDGISYIVHYVDKNNAPVATSKTMMAEAGTTITERAKVVSDYAYKQATQQFTLSEKKKEITFLYDATVFDEQVREEEEVTNVTENTNQGNNATAGQGQGQEQQANQGTGDGTQGDANAEEVEGQETPKAKGKTTAKDNYTPLVVSAVGIAAVLGLLALVLMKKKKNNKA